MKNLLFTAILISMLFSCKVDGGIAPVPDFFVKISFKDTNGIDLLNSKNTASIYKEELINANFLTNTGQLRNANYGTTCFTIVDYPGEASLIQLSFSPPTDCITADKKATLYLSYKNNSEDKFVAELNTIDGLKQIKKLWINDKLVWAGPPDVRGTIILTK